MLQEFVDGLESHGLHFTQPINEIEHSCCEALALNVIDFDRVKTVFTKEQGHSPKSADVLYLDVTNHRIVFIEMKSLLMVDDLQDALATTLDQLGDVPSGRKKSKSYYKALQQQIKETFRVQFEGDKKVIDSVFLLLELAAFVEVSQTCFKYLLQQCEWFFVFLVDAKQAQINQFYNAIPSTQVGQPNPSGGALLHYYKIGSVPIVNETGFQHYFLS